MTEGLFLTSKQLDTWFSANLWLLAHFSVFGGNAIFGVGNTIAAMGLGGVNPLVFAFIREGCSAVGLLAIAKIVLPKGSLHMRREDAGRFVAVGLSVFAMNFFFIMGVKLAGSQSAAIWQPAQPIIATAIAVAIGLESTSRLRLLGITVACTGCLLYSVLDATDGGSHVSMASALEGNFSFFLQGFGCSFLYINQKPLFKRYSPLVILGYAYVVATVVMGCISLIVNETPLLLHFVCPDCTGHGWAVSPDALFGIFYWVFMGSIVAYTLLAWGNKHLDVSIVTVYTVVQPVSTTITSCTVIAFTAPPHYHLEGLSESDWASLGIFIGLALCLYDSYHRNQGSSAPSEMSHNEAGVDKKASAIIPLLQDELAKDVCSDMP
jgi:drug/metabolite transporter (DMT)-like permease